MFERETKQLRCPKCKKYHVQAQAVFDVQEEKKKHGCGYLIYLFCGGIFIEILAAPFKLLSGKKRTLNAQTRTYAVCQDCGYRWEIKQ